MNRKLHVVFLGLIFVFGGVQPFSGWGANGITFLPTNSSDVVILESGKYQLTNNVTSITVGRNATSASTNRTVVLDLHGWSVSNEAKDASETGAHLIQNYVKHFTLTNSLKDKEKMSYIDGMGKSIISDSAGNSFYGRGIFNYVSGTMHFGGNITIRNCIAHDGGAICTQGRFYMTGGCVGEVCESIWSTRKGSNHARRYGGGVFCAGDGVSKLGLAYFEMTGGRVCYNSSDQFGGGICSQYNNAKMYIGGKALVDNNCATCGGGVEIGTSSELTLTNDAVVAFNRSYTGGNSMSGGGIGVGLERSSSTGGMANTLYIKGGSVVSNLAESTSLGGGGVYMRGESGASGGRGCLYMSGGRVNDNVSNGDGGGIYTKGLVELTGGEIVGNVCTNNGGGVYMSIDRPFVSMGGLVSNNVARTGNGGGYYFISGVVVSNGTVVCNRAVNGGGIYAHYATTGGKVETLELSGGLIADNVATGDGGGINSGIKVNMNEGVVASNRAQNGGGVCSTEPTTIVGGSVRENTALKDGGGFYAAGDGALTLQGGEVSKNAAGDSGGGFYVNKVAATLKGSVLVDGNFAATNGGGLAISCDAGKNIVLIGGQVRDNEAGNNGGGIWMTGRASGTGSTYIGNDTAAGTDAEIYGNSAKNGGGIYLTGGTWLTVKGGYIYDNLAVGSPDAKFKTAYNHGDGTGEPEGAGGGIYLEMGADINHRSVLAFDIGKQDIGIFGNIASNAADDVLAEGNERTRIDMLPSVTNMVLEKLAGAIVTGWNEDYRTNDRAYTNHTYEIKDPGCQAERFRDAIRRGATGVTVTTNSVIEVPSGKSGCKVYLCLTLGYIFPVPEKLWITDHEDVGEGKMNLQFRPCFTNETDSAFSLKKWALAAEAGEHLWLTWADDPSQLEANCSNHDHSVSVKLRDRGSAVDEEAHTVWISAPREAIVLDDPNVTNRFYKIVVDDLGEDIRKARAELSE